MRPDTDTRPKAILHIGTMKTGTTSIQRTLDRSGPWLAARGWSYLGWPIRNADVLERRLKKVAPGQNIILSDEGFWHFAGDPRCDTNRIADLLRPYDVTVLVYFRRPDSFLESWFAQGLKHEKGAATVPGFLASAFVRGGTRYWARLQHFADRFGREAIRVAAYERAQMFHGDAVMDFLLRAGLCGPQDTPAGLQAQGVALDQGQNASPGLDTLLLLNMLRILDQLDSAQVSAIESHILPWQARRGARQSLFFPWEIAGFNRSFLPVFRRIQAEFGGGQDPNFFSSWPDPHEAPVCAMRGPYDQFLIGRGLQEPPKPPGVMARVKRRLRHEKKRLRGLLRAPSTPSDKG